MSVFNLSGSDPSPVSQDEDSLQHDVSVTLNLVQVYVTDRQGDHISGLTKDDFILYDNGRLQEITDFEHHDLSFSPAEKPLTRSELPDMTDEKPAEKRMFFFLFDCVFNDQEGIKRGKEAAFHFLRTQMRPDDRIGVVFYTAKNGAEFQVNLTQDLDRVSDTILSLDEKNIFGVPEYVKARRWPHLQRYERSHAYYRDQITRFTSEISRLAADLKSIPGFKHIILFSGGIANYVLYGKTAYLYANWDEITGNPRMRYMYQNMSRNLAAANSFLYSVGVTGTGGADPVYSVNRHFADMRGDQAMLQLSDITGGEYFSSQEDSLESMEKIQDLTSSFYVLGYYISGNHDGKFHKVKVKVKRKDCRVRTQEGYFDTE